MLRPDDVPEPGGLDQVAEVEIEGIMVLDTWEHAYDWALDKDEAFSYVMRNFNWQVVSSRRCSSATLAFGSGRTACSCGHNCSRMWAV